MHEWDDSYVAFFCLFFYYIDKYRVSLYLQTRIYIGKIDMISAIQGWQAKFDLVYPFLSSPCLLVVPHQSDLMSGEYELLAFHFELV